MKPQVVCGIIVRQAIWIVQETESAQIRNPVMFCVFIGSIFTTLLWFAALTGRADALGFIFGISLWLWFTVLFANFAEVMAEGGKAQADLLQGPATRARF
jgi:K+-transporting ATPase ATPase B chain